MLRKTQYVNKHGEIVAQKHLHVGVQFDEEKGYLFWNRKHHARIFPDVDFPEEMSFADRGRMATLAKKIWANTNMLGYRGNGGVKPYDARGIGKVIGVGERQAYRFIEKMINLGMMARVKVETEGKTETQYYLNPIHYCSSNRIPLNLYLLFREQLDAVLPGWVKQKFMDIERKKSAG